MVVTINLLQGAEDANHTGIKCIQLLIGLCFLVLLGLHLFLSLRTPHVLNDIQLLSDEISNLQTQKDFNHNEKIDSHGQQSDSFLKLWSELGRFIDGKLCFSKIERRQEKIFLIGNAQSLLHLTGYLKMLSDANLFYEIHLIESTQQTDYLVSFKLRAIEKNMLPSLKQYPTLTKTYDS